MPFLAYCLIIIIHLSCFSMHACNSRHLGVLHKEPERTNLSQDHKASELSNSALKMTTRTVAGSDMIKQLQVQISDQEKINKILQGWKINHGRRSTLTESSSKLQADSKEEEEAINNKSGKKDDIGLSEDVVVMDYAQPHRKPPIHNIQP